jgi:ubiquinone/menaquinone biosynthesis C-methylase UbiE
MNNKLFNKAAKHYFNQPQLPNDLIEFVKSLVETNKQSKLLDLGCGTGRFTFPMSQAFGTVVAIDPSAEVLAEAKTTADEAHFNNITWIQSAIEDLADNLGKFDMITAARSLHWMDEAKVVPWIYNHLVDNV